MAPFVGQNWGAGRTDRVAEALRIGTRFVVVFGLLVWGLLVLLRVPLASLFSDDPAVARRLRSIYDSPNDVDAWVGGLAEDHVRDGLVGPTWRAVLADQFTRLRDGDRFWYEEYLHDWMVDLVNRQTLATIIRRNTEIGQELQNNPFRVRQGN